MLKSKNVFLMIAVATMASACSTPVKTKADIALDDARAAEIHSKAQADHRSEIQAQMQAELVSVPAWVMEPQKPDEIGVYAVGMAESDVMRVALRKATLDAEFGLAKTYNQEISGSERTYAQDDRGLMGQEQYIGLIEKLVTQVPVTGLEVLKQEVKPIDGKYHAFVLLRLPYAQFNRVLLEQRAKATDATVVKAFDDLQQRLDKRRQQQNTVMASVPDTKIKREIPPPVLNGGLPALPPLSDSKGW